MEYDLVQLFMRNAEKTPQITHRVILATAATDIDLGS
jgi:hypothetical protein